MSGDQSPLRRWLVRLLLLRVTRRSILVTYRDGEREGGKKCMLQEKCMYMHRHSHVGSCNSKYLYSSDSDVTSIAVE